MTLFLFFAALLVLVALVSLVLPLWWRPSLGKEASERREANLAIFRDQLGELEKERVEGSLAEADFAEAQRELRRRLLEDVPVENLAIDRDTGQSSRKLAIALALVLPCLAVAGYAVLGQPQALDPQVRVEGEKVTPEQIVGMVAKLEARLKINPDDVEGWLMLGRSYKSMGRAAEAVVAYGKVEEATSGDPDFLADYADLLAMQAGGSLEGKPLTLIKQALRADPDHLVSLWLAGTAAFNQRDFTGAVVFWERAIRSLAPDSEDARMLRDSIAEAKRRAGVKTLPAKSVAGRLELSPKLSASVAATDTVFIFARPTDGSRAPLAVVKARVADLPLNFTLDDAAAVMPDKRVSDYAEMFVEAKVSRSGNATPGAGDLHSQLAKVRVGEKKLRLVIDQPAAKP